MGKPASVLNLKEGSKKAKIFLKRHNNNISHNKAPDLDPLLFRRSQDLENLELKELGLGKIMQCVVVLQTLFETSNLFDHPTNNSDSILLYLR